MRLAYDPSALESDVDAFVRGRDGAQSGAICEVLKAQRLTRAPLVADRDGEGNPLCDVVSSHAKQ